MAEWMTISLESLFWLVALYGIGILYLFAYKTKKLFAYVFAPVISIGILGVFSLGTYVFAWNINNVLIFVLLLFTTCVLVRVAFERQTFKTSIKSQVDSLVHQFGLINRVRLGVVCVGVLACLACTVYTFTGISLESPVGINVYDNPFHFSVVQHILETGIASPIGAGSVMGDTYAIYPSLWHALTALNCQLFATSVVQSAWVICIVFIAFIASVGIVALTLVLFKCPNLCTLFLAAVLPAVSAKSIFNYIITGSLFANLAGLALVPLALAWIVYLVNSTSSVRPAQRISTIATVCLVCTITLGLTHPSTVFMLFIFLAPFAIVRLRTFLMRILFIGASIGCWFGLVSSSLFARTVNCVDCLAGDIEDGQRFASILKLDYFSLAAIDALPLILFLVCIFVGAVLAYALKRKFANSWYLVGLVFVMAQALCSLFPENWFSILLTGYWYRDDSRFVAAFVFTSACLIAYVPTLVEILLNKIEVLHGQPIIRAAFVGVACLICLIIVSYENTYRESLIKFSTIEAPTNSQIEYMEQVSAITSDAVVLNNADDNSVWLYPIYGVNALIKGHPANQMNSMPDAICLLIEGIDRIGEEGAYGQQIREAAKEVSLEYVVKMSNDPGVTMRFDQSGRIDYQWFEAIAHVDPGTPGLELVYELEGMQLYKVSY